MFSNLQKPKKLGRWRLSERKVGSKRDTILIVLNMNRMYEWAVFHHNLLDLLPNVTRLYLQAKSCFHFGETSKGKGNY